MTKDTAKSRRATCDFAPPGSTKSRSAPPGRRHRHRRPAAALISAVAILVIVAAFAAVFLSVHSTQVSTAETAIHRLRAEAAALAAAQLTLWDVRHDTGQKQAIARVVQEGDTSFQTTPLFQVDGNLAGATFHVDLWPGADTVRLKTVAQSGGVYFERWAQMPIRLEAADDLLKGGDFEDPAALWPLPLWLETASLDQWLAAYGISEVDDPRHQYAPWPWNVTRAGTNHFAEELRWSATLGQYVASRGAKGTLQLEFDYLRRNGNLSVQVRGVNALPRIGVLYPGVPDYDLWTSAGVLLYDSRNLPHSTTWRKFQAEVNAGAGYAYYAVLVESVGGGGGSGTPSSPERAIDNISLKGSR